MRINSFSNIQSNNYNKENNDEMYESREIIDYLGTLI